MAEKSLQPYDKLTKKFKMTISSSTQINLGAFQSNQIGTIAGRLPGMVLLNILLAYPKRWEFI